TGTLWDHITGQAMYGPLAGKRMPVFNALHTNVEEALAADPDLRVAISDRPMREERGSLASRLGRMRMLPPPFRRTMAGEDTRRPTLDVGIGVWTEETARYYPLETVRAAGNLLVDSFGGRNLAIYVEPVSGALSAMYTDATEALWEGEELHLGDGTVLRDGRLWNAGGEPLEVERPLQVFTRWYGFALTFPGTEVYEP
ncbi:MAG: DUF3179 domain-containing (seleno)protein, partial [Gemmatimonadota bacterium]